MSAYDEVDLGGLKNKKKPVPRMSISYVPPTPKSVSFNDGPSAPNSNVDHFGRGSNVTVDHFGRGSNVTDSPDSIMKDLGYNPFPNDTSPSLSNLTSSIPNTPVDHLGGLKNKKSPVKRMSISYNPKDENYGRPQFEAPVSPRPAAPPTPTAKTPNKGGPSASLTALTGSSKNRRQSFGMVVSPTEMLASPRASPQHVGQASSAHGTAAKSAPPGPAFMKGTSSTRCRRASFDLHCLDQAGGSLSAAGVVHRSFLNDQAADAPVGRLTTSQLAANNSAHVHAASAGQQHAQYLQQQFPGVDAATAAMSQRIFEAGVQAAPLNEVNQDQRYSIYHPRYRMPRNVFGFSKPFVKKPDIKKQHIRSNFTATTTSYESLMTPRHIVEERDAFRKSVS